jgi:AraC family transcriptional regulator, regulatory protein of adaptative response / methylated-DNA-[protein]-cysteine methyltransferase
MNDIPTTAFAPDAPASVPVPVPAGFAEDETRWQAVLARDPAAERRFVYAVSTTGVYCRPTCPSRRPRRANIRFFADGASAERAGFRACRRCRPGTPDPQAEAVRRACDLIERSEKPPSLAEMAGAAGLSPSHFHRVFRRTLGVTPREYAAMQRAQRLQRDLAGGAPVAEAIYGAGFGSGSRVYEHADATLGMTPATYRRGGEGMLIRHAVVASELGPVIVAATERGVCMIEFGDTQDELVGRLGARFPKARLEPADEALRAWVEAVADYVRAPSRGIRLPVDMLGTAFQQRVWTALAEIPVGTTLGYAELAARIGSPKAVRAVAGACAANPVALAVPCHRVVGKDGSLTGYRWGTERKRALIEGERGGGERGGDGAD